MKPLRLTRRAFTLIEVLVVLGIVIIVAVIAFSSFSGGKSQADLNSATSQIAASARQAESQAMAQSGNVVWGIHFANATNTAPYYAVFTGSSYASGTIQGHYALPPTVAYVTSTLPVGSSMDVTFSQITGAASASTSIGLYLIANPSDVQNIAISGIGEVNYGSGTSSGPSQQYIWVADNSNNRVEKFNSSGVYQSQLGICSSGACVATSTNGGFNGPTGIAIDSGGNVWVADNSNNRVEKFNSSGVYQSQIGICSSGACVATSTNGGFNGPQGIAIDSGGNVWIADNQNNRVEKFNSSGVYQSQIGACSSGQCGHFPDGTNGAIFEPFGVAVDSAGNIWVADTDDARVEQFNSSGVYQSQIGICGSGACAATTTSGGFGSLWAGANMAVDSSGNIWVAEWNNLTDQGNNRVDKFNPYSYQSQLGCSSGACAATATNGGFGGAMGGGGPWAVAVDSAGNIWVTDTGSARVEKFNSSGVYQSQIGICSSGACVATTTSGGFSSPSYIATYPSVIGIGSVLIH